MPLYVLIIDGVCAVLLIIGFMMAFCQKSIRQLLGVAEIDRHQQSGGKGDGDPATYILRIAGVMLMMLSFAVGGMMTLFHVMVAA